MRMRMVYVLLAVLAVVTLSSVWITQQVSKIPVIATPAALQSEPLRRVTRPVDRPVRHAFVKRPRTAIAVLGEAPIEAAGATVSMHTLPGAIARRSTPDKAWVSSPADDAGGSAGNTTAGVVKYRKYPTAEESHEMNAHGIVMY